MDRQTDTDRQTDRQRKAYQDDLLTCVFIAHHQIFKWLHPVIKKEKDIFFTQLNFEVFQKHFFYAV